MKNNINTNTSIIDNRERNNTLFVVVLTILGIVAITFLVLFLISARNASLYASSLEGIYQKSYYDLADNVNNIEVRMSKILSTEDEEYIGELLVQVSKNTNDAQINLSSLPISVNGIEESISFINQLGGFCETLSKKIAEGGELTYQEKETLHELYSSILKMKGALSKVWNKIADGYSILNNSISIKENYNDFTIELQSIKTNDVEYPTMIYDGPFADSLYNQEVKVLNNSTNIVNEEKAKNILAKLCGINSEDIEYQGETESNFETYNFTYMDSNGNEFYAQISKPEGRLITLAGNSDDRDIKVDVQDAKVFAEEFILKSGVGNVECVWYDVVDGNGYFNFAPVVEGVILYPDLIKVKCNLAYLEILGYEAQSYYINHTKRELSQFKITEEEALSKIKEGFYIESIRKVLAPIEYKELLCYEFGCYFNGEVYYIYVNGITGSVENILKVIPTSDGSKLM